jgi:GTPase KRas
MRNGEGFLLMYNITSRSSFEEIFDFHENILRAKDSSQVPIVIVGNKCDLEFQREVGRNEGRETAEKLGCRFMETSAKMSINVDEAFATIVREIRRFNKVCASILSVACLPDL